MSSRSAVSKLIEPAKLFRMIFIESGMSFSWPRTDTR
jgi:hypothetical protein